jgi:hypothetical protein
MGREAGPLCLAARCVLGGAIVDVHGGPPLDSSNLGQWEAFYLD